MDLDAVALDLDGTLLEPDGHILPEVREALRTAAARGIEVYIVTGRPWPFVRELVAAEFGPRSPLPHGVVAEERDLYLRETGVWQPSRENILRHRAELGLSRELAPLLQRCRAELSAMDPEHWVCSEEVLQERGFWEFRFRDSQCAALASAVLVRRLAGVALGVQVIRNVRGVALRHPDSAKGASLARLAAIRGRARERILAVGDSENDRSMLDGSWGFLAACPANAEPSIGALVRERKGLWASRPRGAGVAEALQSPPAPAEPSALPPGRSRC